MADPSRPGWTTCEPRRLQGVDQQHRDRHRPDAAGNRRDRRRDLGRGVEVDVAAEAVLGAVHADVDHHRPGLDRVGAEQFAARRPRRPARRRGGRSRRGRGCASGRSVTVALAASSRRATGTPTSFERPTTTASAPSSSTPSWAQQLHHPGRRAGHQSGRAVGEQPGVERGQAVDVLARVDRGDDRVGVDLRREPAAARGSRRPPRRCRERRPAPAAPPRSSRRRARDGPTPCRPPRRPCACCGRRSPRPGRRRRSPSPGPAPGPPRPRRPRLRRAPARAPPPPPPCRRSIRAAIV